MEKIEWKPPENHTNSLKTAVNSANSYSTENSQHGQGSDYNDGAMSLRNEDKSTTMTTDPMKRLNKITDNCVLGKWKRKSYAEPTQSDPLEGKSVGVPPNLGKVDAESGCEHKYNTDDSRMNRVLRKRKRTTYAEASQSDLTEGKSVGIPPNVGNVDAESGNRSVDLEAIKMTLLNAEVSKFSNF